MLAEDDRLRVAVLGNDLEFGDAAGEVEGGLDGVGQATVDAFAQDETCLLYTSPSPRDEL